MINIYVGNLPFKTTDADLAQLFAPFGVVEKASIISDRDTGRSRGFGFVEMSADDEGRNAIAALNGKDVEGRALTVNEAKPRTDNRPPRQSGYTSGSGGYGNSASR